MASSAVFALCARSIELHIPGLFANLEGMAALYDRAAFVFVENDSTDNTKTLIKSWIEGRDGALIELDGLGAIEQARTERIAVCRNAYMDFIRGSPLAAHDHLVIMDSDSINRRPVDLEGFSRARDWLEEHDAAAVFANSTPFYYDIWALRHPTWCPRNFMRDIREAAPESGAKAAGQRFRFDRQIPISPTAEPIEVQSAFGGLAIYRMADALGGRYAGTAPDGLGLCEHVPFNQDVSQGGRRLYILPWMTTGSRTAGLHAPPDGRIIPLEQADASCELTGPEHHLLDRDRKEHPLHGRRLPVLARLIGEAAPMRTVLDIGAGIGSTIALCRLEGAQVRFVAVEAALRSLKWLMINRQALPDLFHDVKTMWSSVGRPGDDAQLEPPETPTSHAPQPDKSFNHEAAPDTTIEAIARSPLLGRRKYALIKIDADGGEHAILNRELQFLKRIAPILWAKAQTRRLEDDAAWERFLDDACGKWPLVVAFDHRGHALVAGDTAANRQTIVGLIAAARRQTAASWAKSGADDARHLDIALFPRRFEGIFEAFRAELPELKNGRGLPA